MSRSEKRLEAMRRNPRGDWTIDDVKALRASFGIACTPPARGSHYDVQHPAVAEILTIPAEGPSRRCTSGIS